MWAMIQLQRFTAMRPGEVTRLRMADIDASGSVWIYSPPRHKTAHRGHGRKIYLGPRAQAVLKPWMRTDLTAFLFSPKEAVEQQLDERSRRRRTPLSCGNRRGKGRKRAPSRPPSVVESKN